MGDITCIIHKMVAFIVIMMFSVCILFVAMASVVYIVGYVYDSIFGNSILRLGHFIGRKHPKIKNMPMIVKAWKKIQPKEVYLRYETPLFAYCFSYTAISLLLFILPDENGMSIITASVLYVSFYFVGMARKCGGNEQYYDKVLNNNMEFLKLSFLPLGFIITVSGFFFTITGVKVQELPFDLSIFEKLYTSLKNYNLETDILILFLKMMELSGIVWIVFYIMSLPVQVFSYFVISIIKYFRKYAVGYIGLFKKYCSIIAYLLKNI